MIAMRRHPERILGHLHFRLEKSELLLRCSSKNTVQKAEPRNYSQFENDGDSISGAEDTIESLMFSQSTD